MGTLTFSNIPIPLRTTPNDASWGVGVSGVAHAADTAHGSSSFLQAPVRFELRQAQTQLYTAQQEYLQAMVDVINRKTALENILNL